VAIVGTVEGLLLESLLLASLYLGRTQEVLPSPPPLP
jgi:hypothetical protein